MSSNPAVASAHWGIEGMAVFVSCLFPFSIELKLVTLLTELYFNKE